MYNGLIMTFAIMPRAQAAGRYASHRDRDDRMMFRDRSAH